LDFTFWRVYDENGQPLQTSHYFKFNPSGARPGELTFVIGNPGRTSRQFTVADLEFLRDVQIPAQLLMLTNQSAALKKVYQRTRSDSLLNVIFSLENTIKARTGALKALQDPYIIARRAAFENNFKAAATAQMPEAEKIWETIAQLRKEYSALFPAVLAAQPASTGFQLAQAIWTLAPPTSADENTLKRMRNLVDNTTQPTELTLEAELLLADIVEMVALLGENHPTVKQLLKGKTPAEYAEYALRATKIYDVAFRNQLIEKGMIAVN
ncbi:MAG: S46 family peptidase, partial [Cytophagales bacterium]|nr:S46 family peptidase [Cytophagales bacterium]